MFPFFENFELENRKLENPSLFLWIDLFTLDNLITKPYSTVILLTERFRQAKLTHNFLKDYKIFMRVKSDEKRQAIIDIAKECFSQQGVSGTSMSQLAKQVGGSKATLYNYFSSKEEIFAEVMQSSATEQISNSFLSLDVNRDVRTSLLEFGYNFLDSILTPDAISIYRMAVAEADRSDIGRHFYNNGPKKGWKHLSEYIEKQSLKGELSQCNPWIAAMQFKALLSSEYVEQYAFAAIDKPSQQQIKTTVEQAVNAFMKLYGNE